jgi:hypothetical protein
MFESNKVAIAEKVAIAACAVFSGIVGTRAFDSISEPSPDRVPPITEREQLAMETLAQATKALKASTTLNKAYSNDRLANSLPQYEIDLAKERGITFSSHTQEELHDLAVALDKEVTKFCDDFSRLELKYTIDYWAALVDGSRK